MLPLSNDKVITHSDKQEVPITSWTDETDWPDLELYAQQVNCVSSIKRLNMKFIQGYQIIGINFECIIENKDDKTKKSVDSFRSKFTEQLCHKDDEIK